MKILDCRVSAGGNSNQRSLIRDTGNYCFRISIHELTVYLVILIQRQRRERSSLSTTCYPKVLTTDLSSTSDWLVELAGSFALQEMTDNVRLVLIIVIPYLLKSRKLTLKISVYIQKLIRHWGP